MSPILRTVKVGVWLGTKKSEPHPPPPKKSIKNIFKKFKNTFKWMLPGLHIEFAR
jgi:hypothetical protein